MQRISRAQGALCAASARLLPRVSGRSVASAAPSRHHSQFVELASIKLPTLQQCRSITTSPSIAHLNFPSTARTTACRSFHAPPPALSTPPAPAPENPEPHGGSKWEHFKDEMRRYWTGLKLLKAEFKIAWKIVRRLLHGESLTRREKQQLSRSAGDLLKLVPFIVIVIVPFMELALPVLLYLFPNMLPSTFTSQLKREENLQKKLRARIEVAKFLQKALDDMAEAAKASATPENKDVARKFAKLMQGVRGGERVENADLIKISKLFTDELTLDNLPRAQLVLMCRLLNISDWGTDGILRMQLRNRLEKIKHDDVMIAKETVEALSTMELRAACSERGMPAAHLTKSDMRGDISRWIELSLHHNIPSSLLILSRAMLQEQRATGAEAAPDAGLQRVIATMPDTIVKELSDEAAAVAGSAVDPNMVKLERLKLQEKLIDEERIVVASNDPAATVAASAIAVTASLHRSAGDVGRAAKHADADVRTVSTDDKAAAVEWKAGDAQVTISQEKLAEISEAIATLSDQSAMSSLKRDVIEVGQGIAARKVREELDAMSLRRSSLADGADDALEPSASVQHDSVVKAATTEQAAAAAAAAVAVFAKGADTVGAAAVAAAAFVQGSSSSVAADKTALNGIDSVLTQTPAATASNVIEKKEKQKLDKEKRTQERLQREVEGMVNALASELRKTEDEIGAKMKVLDKDGDGQITEQEIKDGLAMTMKRPPSQEELAAVVRALDTDHDGKISVEEVKAKVAELRDEKKKSDASHLLNSIKPSKETAS